MVAKPSYFFFKFFYSSFKMLKLTENYMWLFIKPLYIGDENYVECTVDFRIKGDKSANVTEIQ